MRRNEHHFSQIFAGHIAEQSPMRIRDQNRAKGAGGYSRDRLLQRRTRRNLRNIPVHEVAHSRILSLRDRREHGLPGQKTDWSTGLIDNREFVLCRADNRL